MTALERNVFSERLPDSVEIKNAKQVREIIASQIKGRNEPTKLSLVLDGNDVQTVTLSPVLTDSLLDLLGLVSSGHGIVMIPVEAELTTQEAADLLNVSRPYLVKLLENDQMPYVKIGRHRRIRATDVFEYRTKRDAKRSEALKALAEIDAEELA